MVKLLLDVNGIPQENLNLVTYNSGGKARAAVAGGVVDFIAISAEGSESIREYIRPVAIISEQRSLQWGVPAINDLLQPLGTRVPVLPGSVRGFATTSEFKRKHPERFAKIVAAMQAALVKPALIEQLAAAQMGSRWVGPNKAEKIMHDNFTVYQKYAYLLKWQR